MQARDRPVFLGYAGDGSTKAAAPPVRFPLMCGPGRRVFRSSSDPSHLIAAAAFITKKGPVNWKSQQRTNQR